MSVINKVSLFQETDFTDCNVVIAAVSGGSDSLALLFLLNDHLKQLPKAPKLVAVTVDHRLRAESAKEAEDIAAICKKQNIEHKIVCWADAKPQTALSRNARIARYGLLFSEAERQGANVVMVGHTLNDQAETYQMRKSRNSQRGLSCMPREALLMRKVRLIRPFLGVKREELRDYLRGLGQGWIDDPSNDNDFYERVRVRKSLDEKDIDGLQKLIDVAAKKRRDQAVEAAKLFQKLGVVVKNDLCTMPYPEGALQTDDALPFVIGTIIAIMGGSLYLPTDTQLNALKSQLQKNHQTAYRLTLLGAVVEFKKNTIRIWREARNQSNSAVGAQTSALWDGRFRIDNNGSKPIYVGSPTLSRIKTIISKENLSSKDFHFLSLQTSVALFNQDEVDIPAINGKLVYAKDVTCTRYMRPFGWLVSQDDYPLVEVLKPVFEFCLSLNQKNIDKTA